MSKNLKLFLTSLLVMLCIFGVANFVLAQEKPITLKNAVKTQLQAAQGAAGVQNIVDPRYAVARMIRVVLNFVGLIFLVLTIYAGFLWMTAGGAEEKVEKAQKLIKRSMIGLLIILSAYSITWIAYKIVALRTDQPYNSGVWIENKGEIENIHPWNN